MPAHIPDQGFKARSSKQIEEYTIKLNPEPVSEGGSHKIVYSGKKKHASFNLRIWVWVSKISQVFEISN